MKVLFQRNEGLGTSHMRDDLDLIHQQFTEVVCVPAVYFEEHRIVTRSIVTLHYLRYLFKFFKYLTIKLT